VRSRSKAVLAAASALALAALVLVSFGSGPVPRGRGALAVGTARPGTVRPERGSLRPGTGRPATTQPGTVRPERSAPDEAGRAGSRSPSTRQQGAARLAASLGENGRPLDEGEVAALVATALDEKQPTATRCAALDRLAETRPPSAEDVARLGALAGARDVAPELRDAVFVLLQLLAKTPGVEREAMTALLEAGARAPGALRGRTLEADDGD